MNNTVRREEYIGEVLSDGHLSLPDAVRERLKLTPSSIVKVVITHEIMENERANKAWNLFRSLGRTAVPGILTNSAEEHDRYLYGKGSK